MTREDCYNYTCFTYQEFYRKVSLKQDYVFDPRVKLGSVSGSDYVNSFIDFLDKEWGLIRVDINMIFNFVEFGFSYRLKTLNEYNKISYIKFNYIFCKKMYEVFLKRKHKITSYRRLNVNSNIYNKVVSLKQRIDSEIMLTNVNRQEEELKKIYYQQEESLIWCATQTSMYNDKSELCNKCNYRVRCKQILKQESPKIYKLRGYE